MLGDYKETSQGISIKYIDCGACLSALVINLDVCRRQSAGRTFTSLRQILTRQPVQFSSLLLYPIVFVCFFSAFPSSIVISFQFRSFSYNFGIFRDAVIRPSRSLCRLHKEQFPSSCFCRLYFFSLSYSTVLFRLDLLFFI